MNRAMSEFVICIDNQSNPASLIVGKVYRRLPDAKAESHQMLRIIDEDASDSDGYLYPASMFAPVELPEEAKHLFITAGS
jgi:hypothetical protein